MYIVCRAALIYKKKKILDCLQSFQHVPKSITHIFVPDEIV
jgi:hypothetical protein